MTPEGPPIHPQSQYLHEPEIRRLLAGDWRERYQLGHAGHGANSYAISCTVVTDRVAVIAQRGWGGVYSDKERATAEVKQMCADVGEVLHFAQEAEPWPGGRLLVADSNFRRAAPLAWVAGPGARPVPVEGKSRGLKAALGYLPVLAEGLEWPDRRRRL